MCYVAARDYLTAQQKQTFADKMYNDLSDPSATGCNKAHTLPANEVLATGAAQAGSSTSITLASGDTAAGGFYVNNVIAATVGGNTSLGTVTAYTASTKVATVASWSNGVPTSGTAYTIYASIVISNAASGATATVTGYNTHFTADVSAGDAVFGDNSWSASGIGGGEVQSYVSAVNRILC